MKVFFDSDVILDALLQRRPFHIPAIRLLDLAYRARFDAVTSSVVFINVNYFLNKYASRNRVQALKRFRAIVSILNVDERTIDLAMASNFSDFEDAIQYYTAQRAGCTFIVSRNFRDYRNSDITVLNSEQLLELLNHAT